MVASDSDILPLQRSAWREGRNYHRRVHALNAFCCSPLREDESGRVVADEGFYDPQLHSLADDARVLHVPVCSVGAEARVWGDVFGVGDGDWDEKALKDHVVDHMEKQLGEQRARRGAFDKQQDLAAWFVRALVRCIAVCFVDVLLFTCFLFCCCIFM